MRLDTVLQKCVMNRQTFADLKSLATMWTRKGLNLESACLMRLETFTSTLIGSTCISQVNISEVMKMSATSQYSAIRDKKIAM